MDILNALNEFNLTRQEAALYLTLYTEGSLTGYEASKITGISRSNAYTSLANLVEKGAAYLLEGQVSRYTAVSPENFCNNILRKMTKTKELLLKNLPDKGKDVDGYITIRGDKHILDKVMNMIRETQKRIYISVSHTAFTLLEAELSIALKRGLKLVVITNHVLELLGAMVYVSNQNPMAIRIITDSENVLTGDVGEGETSTCLFSKNKNLVDLIKDSLKNEIKLIEIQQSSENR